MSVSNFADLKAKFGTTSSSKKITISNDVTLTGTLTINEDVTIDGKGHTISGEGKFQVFEITGGTVTIRNLTITGGYSNGVGGGNSVGGGMLLSRSSSSSKPNVTLINCTFAGNKASSNGGGVCINITGITATLVNCTFTDNTADRFGGGLYVTGPDSTAAVVNCTFVDNKATNNGPEVFVDGSATLNAVNTIFWNTGTAITGNVGVTANLYNCAYGIGGMGDGTDGFKGKVNADSNCITDLDWTDRKAEPETGVFMLTKGDKEDDKLIDKGLPVSEIKVKIPTLSEAVEKALAGDQLGHKRDGKPDIGAVEYGAEEVIEPDPVEEEDPDEEESNTPVEMDKTAATLEDAVRNLTEEQKEKLKSMTDLELDGYALKNLKGIEKLFPNLTKLDVKNCESMTEINVAEMGTLKELNVSSCKNLKSLDCHDNKVENLKIEDCANLENVDCSYNQLTMLDIDSAKLTALSSLKCNNQSRDTLVPTSSNGVWSVNLSQFVKASSAESVAVAGVAEIQNVMGYNDKGGTMLPTNTWNATDGTVTFPSWPVKVTYDYDTGYSDGTENVLMDVTLNDEVFLKNGMRTGTSGGGFPAEGCDAGFGLLALAVLPMIMKRRS